MSPALPTGDALRLPPGTVRPRYVTEEGDALLVSDLADEVTGPAPGRLVLRGPRGSGLTTALGVLAAEVAARPGLQPLPFEALWSDPSGRALEALRGGQAVLLVDLSVTPLQPHRWRRIRHAFCLGLPGRTDSAEGIRGARAVVAVPCELGRLPEEWLPGLAPTRTCDLAAWSDDDLLELLGAPAYRDQRARLFAGLRGAAEVSAALRRPRACRWLVDAAAALGADEPCTLGRLYANVLDALAPETLELLAGLEEDSHDALVARLDQPGAAGAEQVAALFEQAYLWAWAHAGALEPWTTLVREALGVGDPGPSEAAAVARARAQRIHGLTERPGRLLLSGLQHFLQVGRCLAGVARGEAPTEVRRPWLPFVPELLSDPAREHLRGWCRRGARCAGESASLLWAAAEVPPLERVAGGLLRGAILPGVALPGANFAVGRITGCDLTRADLARATLRSARLTRTTLAGADLTGASLAGATLKGCDLAAASLLGATLDHATLARTSLRSADLTGASLGEASLEGCDLAGADLTRARLAGTALEGGRLTGADLSGADLTRASLDQVDVAGAQFAGARMEQTKLRAVDLRRAKVGAAWLSEAAFERCALTGLDLEAACLAGARLWLCELSDLYAPAADLRGAMLQLCRAHGAVFDGADLREAVFAKVNFQAGSSRAGLLLGKPALEGSMTGYYAEGTSDDAWSSPDSIRTASFQGADLRGAKFSGTDLFRVDLRGALLDPDLAERARKAGALL